MLLTEEVNIKVFSKCSYYENLGYVFEKHIVGSHKKLMISRNLIAPIKVIHLTKTSNCKIEYSCDKCKNIFTTNYCNYTKARKDKGDLCRKCSIEEYNSGKNHKSFGKKLNCGFKSGKENYGHINFKGKNNPNYNSNLTDEERIKNRDLIENINWRNLIFKRDNYKCKICENKKIEAHHLNSYTNYPQERFNINNGITLCKDCHKSYHKTKGYKNATKEKYEEYINEISCVSFN